MYDWFCFLLIFLISLILRNIVYFLTDNYPWLGFQFLLDIREDALWMLKIIQANIPNYCINSHHYHKLYHGHQDWNLNSREKYNLSPQTINLSYIYASYSKKPKFDKRFATASPVKVVGQFFNLSTNRRRVSLLPTPLWISLHLCLSLVSLSFLG